jgi:hypothetical protein
MSEQETGTPQTDTPGQGQEAPPQVEPVTPPEPSTDTPQENPETVAAVGKPDGRSVDASDDPNLGHAFEDQAQGVGVGPTQTSEQGEGSSADTAEAI